LNCPRCRNQNLDDALFCDECGTPLETACSSCGEANRRGAKFCKKCGESLSRTAVAASSTATNIPVPRPSIPKHLAEKILASRHALEGERKQVTILFADIKDSTRLVEGRDPEQAQQLLDPILKTMMDAVHRYEGTVNHILGDGIMALFGAPLAHEDHAVRACYAALAMQQQLRHYADEIGPSDELPRICIGLNSGEVVVRSIDNDLKFDYLAVGDSIHLAARMQELADPGAILMTARTLSEVEGFVQVTSLGLLQAKGFARLIESFELTGVTAVRKRLHAAVARGLSGFVGRSTEVEIFKRVLQQASSRHGQILALYGEPGMGKSRLVYEFTHSHLPPQWTVLEATSASYGKATPYYPLIELLRRYFQVHEGESRETIRLKVQMHLLELDARLKDAIPPLLALLDALPDAESQGRTDAFSTKKDRELSELIYKFAYLEPQQRRRLTFEALKRVLIRESLKQPVLLLMEDLHWIDNETQAFLDDLVESLPMTRLLLLVNHRPGYSHTWSDKSYYTQIRVDPLPEQGAEELLRFLLGDNQDLAPLKELLIKRTEGNPFFVEESVRSLVESEFLTGIKGQYRPGLKIDSIRIPSTVQTVLADRIDRLPTAEKHLLQTASAIGVIVPMALLRAVAGLPEDELHRHLATLRSAEFLYESNLFPDLEYTFKHALTNEVVYGAMLHDHKTLLHARIVTAIEQIQADKLPDHIETLAHHAFHGELWEKAVSYLKEAGLKAISRSGFGDAVTCFERALEALQHLPETQETLRHTIDLRFDFRNAFFLMGAFDQALSHLEAAKAPAEALGDKTRLGQLYNFMTAHWNLTGESSRAIPLAEQAANLTVGPGERDLHIVAHYYLGIACHNTGNYARAVEVLKKGLSLIGERKHERFATTGIVFATGSTWLARSLAQTGDFCDAIAAATQAVVIGEETNDSYSLSYGLYSLGMVLLIQGKLNAAISPLERALDICRTSSIPVQLPLIWSCLGFVYALSGKIDAGQQLLQQAVESGASMRRIGGQPMRMAWLCEALLSANRIKEAQSIAQNAFDVVRKVKDRGGQAWILRLLAQIEANCDSPDYERARSYYEQSLELATELGMRPVQAHCHDDLGHLYFKMEKYREAWRELSTAIEFYQNLEMTFWLPAAETSLAKINKQRLM
jgi:class 3 adenylate cyclase/tetratricopeptide (TPR) repeat protein